MDDGPQRLPAGRKASVAAIVADLGQVTVSELAERFGVSADTIRRDLDQLDDEGALIRTHGGAMTRNAVPWHDTGLDDRTRLRPTEKDQIGAVAASLVTDGSVLLINAGTTTLAMVRHLSNRRELIVATNNLRIPSVIAPEIVRDLYVIGGHVRVSGQVTIGPVSFANSLTGQDVDVQVDLALISVGAVDSAVGYSTSSLHEAAMMYEMAKRATKVAILADSSKFDRHLFAKVGPLDLADYLITDAQPSAELSHSLAEAGVAVLLPSSLHESA